jgi:hypothetical protein
MPGHNPRQVWPGSPKGEVVPAKQKSRKKIVGKKKPPAVHVDFGRFSLLFFSAVILLFAVMIFYFCAAVLLQKSFFSSINAHPPLTPFVESLNYRGYQAPKGLPEELLAGKSEKNFIASQEFSDAKTHNLKFVSFKSRISSEALLGYYQNYLLKNLYLQSAVSWPGRIIEIQGQRGASSLRLMIKPAAGGSVVSVYQRDFR